MPRTWRHRLGSARPACLVRVESVNSMPRRLSRVSKFVGSSASRSSIRNPWTWLSMISAWERSMTLTSVPPAMGLYQSLVVHAGERFRLAAAYREERIEQDVPHGLPEDLRFLQMAHGLLHRPGQPLDA